MKERSYRLDEALSIFAVRDNSAVFDPSLQLHEVIMRLPWEVAKEYMIFKDGTLNTARFGQDLASAGWTSRRPPVRARWKRWVLLRYKSDVPTFGAGDLQHQLASTVPANLDVQWYLPTDRRAQQRETSSNLAELGVSPDPTPTLTWASLPIGETNSTRGLHGEDTPTPGRPWSMGAGSTPPVPVPRGQPMLLELQVPRGEGHLDVGSKKGGHFRQGRAARRHNRDTQQMCKAVGLEFLTS